MTILARILCFLPFVCMGVGVGWELGPGWGLFAAALAVWIDLKLPDWESAE